VDEAQPADDEPTFRDVGEMLEHLGFDGLDDLADYFADDLDSDVSIEVVADGYNAPAIAIVLDEYGRGVEEPFPMTLREVWEDLYDIEAECQLPSHLEFLAYDIERVEQIEVEVELDEWISDPVLVEAIGRRLTASGILVQYMHTLSYPYHRRMSGKATVGEWLTARVFKHSPGVRVSLRGDRSMTLNEARQLDSSYPLTDFGMEDRFEDPAEDSSKIVARVPRGG